MRNIHKILYATDFSDTSKAAEKYAMELRDSLGAELHVAHVFDPASFEMPAPYLFMPGAGTWLEVRLDELRSKGSKHLEAYAGGINNCTAHFLEGRPGQALVEFVEANDIDLVVMGTHGHSGFESLLLGSVAEYVMRHTPVPVLTIKRDT